MGIRTEDIHDSEIFVEASSKSVIEATVNVTEMLGAETFLYLSLEDNDITAKVDSRSLAKSGDRMKLAIDMN